MDDPRPTRHLKGPDDLVWFDLDPARFVARAAAHGDERLSIRLTKCRRGAWRCDSYLAFQELTAGCISQTTVIYKDGGEHLAVDLDRDGNPVGIEFLSRLPCSSD
jgi:hypothetical protein